MPGIAACVFLVVAGCAMTEKGALPVVERPSPRALRAQSTDVLAQFGPSLGLDVCLGLAQAREAAPRAGEVANALAGLAKSSGFAACHRTVADQFGLDPTAEGNAACEARAEGFLRETVQALTAPGAWILYRDFARSEVADFLPAVDEQTSRLLRFQVAGLYWQYALVQWQLDAVTADLARVRTQSDRRGGASSSAAAVGAGVELARARTALEQSRTCVRGALLRSLGVSESTDFQIEVPPPGPGPTSLSSGDVGAATLSQRTVQDWLVEALSGCPELGPANRAAVLRAASVRPLVARVLPEAQAFRASLPEIDLFRAGYRPWYDAMEALILGLFGLPAAPDGVPNHALQPHTVPERRVDTAMVIVLEALVVHEACVTGARRLEKVSRHAVRAAQAFEAALAAGRPPEDVAAALVEWNRSERERLDWLAACCLTADVADLIAGRRRVPVLGAEAAP